MSSNGHGHSNGKANGTGQGPEGEKSWSTMSLLKVLLFGLILYTVNVGLQISIGAYYLGMRDCHRGITMEYNNFNLANALGQNPNKFTTTTQRTTTSTEDPEDWGEGDDDYEDEWGDDAGGDEDEEEDDWGDDEVVEAEVQSETTTKKPKAKPQKWIRPMEDADNSFLEDLISERTYVRLRSHLIKVMPDHWVEKISDIVTFQASNYPPSKVADYCTLNGNDTETIFDLGYGLCANALSPQQYGKLRALTDEFSNTELDGMYNSFIEGDLIGAAKQAPKALDIEVPDRIWELAEQVTSKLTKSDFKVLLEFAKDPQIIKNMPAFLKAVGKIQPDDMTTLKAAMGKVNPKNVAEIDGLLSDLGVTMFEFISNPSLLIKFFRDPKLSQTLARIRKLLPVFESSDLNVMLKVQKTFSQEPGATAVMKKALGLPLPLTSKLTSVQFEPEDIEKMRSLMSIMKDPRLVGAMEVAKELQLTTELGRAKFMSQCSHDHLEVKCADTSEDLCPYGHIHYGLLTLLILAVPGMLFGYSEFMHFKAFRFGGLTGKMYGQSMNSLAKYLLVPFYMIAMAPVAIVVTIWTYARTLSKIFNQKSPQKIQETYDAALNLHAIHGSASSHFQIIVQLHFMIILFMLGAGTTIQGMDVATFTRNIAPLTLASIVLSYINFAYTTWKLKTLDHRVQQLPMQGDSVFGTVLWFSWFNCQWFTTLISLTVLCLIGWIEMFSNSILLPNLPPVNEFIVPIVILYVSFPINEIMHRKNVQEDDPYSRAHGTLSAVFPARFLHRTNRGRTRRFLLNNQFTSWAVRVAAWFAYSIILFGLHGEDFGIFKVLPIFAAIASFAPFLGVIHWAKVINPAYRGTPKKVDQSELPKVSRMAVYRIWQLDTVITRVLSIVLVLVVYFDHWQNFYVVYTFNIPGTLTLVYLLPWVALLFVGHTGLQLGFYAKSDIVTSGWLSAFLPNNFRRASVGRAGRYLVTNFALNLALQLLLWLSMTFYCWECTRVLDPEFTLLSACFPVVIVMWIINLILTLVAWFASIRNSLDETRGGPDSDPRMEKTGVVNKGAEVWTEKESSVTTQF